MITKYPNQHTRHYVKHRDRHTGHFVKRSTWKRSKAHGGTRYVRVRIKQRRPQRRPHLGVIIRSGYSSRENSYTLTVQINPWKFLSDQNISNLVSILAAKGHFDDSDENPVTDLSWATFHNSFIIVKREIEMQRGSAILLAFDRQPPEGLP